MSKYNAVKTQLSNSGKRVEFSGTEIHFSSDSKKINIRLGSDHQPPPQHVIGTSSHEKILRNGTTSTTHEVTPKKGILKNRITTPDKYYLGQLDEIVDDGRPPLVTRRKKITHQNHHHHHVERTSPETEFDTFNGKSTTPLAQSNTIDSSSVSRSNQRSPAGKANLTSYKLIIDMLGHEDKSAHSPRNDDFDLLSHKKSDFAQFHREKIFRPIAKPRKIYPTDTPRMNSLTSSPQTMSSIKSHKFSGDDHLIKTSTTSHMGNGYSNSMKLSSGRFDLARDEKVLSDLINAADEIINQNM